MRGDLDLAARDAGLAQRGHDLERARRAADRRDAQRAGGVVDRAEGAPAVLRGRDVELRRDARGLRDLDVVRAIGRWLELEAAHAVVHGGELGDHPAAVVEDLALDVGGLAERGLRREVDAARDAGDQIAALGVHLEADRLHHDRDPLLH